MSETTQLQIDHPCKEDGIMFLDLIQDGQRLRLDLSDMARQIDPASIEISIAIDGGVARFESALVRGRAPSVVDFSKVEFGFGPHLPETETRKGNVDE